MTENWLVLFVAGCTKDETPSNPGGGGDFTQDTTVNSLSVGANQTVTIANGAVVTSSSPAANNVNLLVNMVMLSQNRGSMLVR